jgi:hypothetical protein
MPRCRFGLVLAVVAISTGPAMSKDPPSPEVAAVSKDLRDKLKLDPFYKKHLDLAGLPILASDKVSDEGLVEAAHLIRQILSEREDILQAMVKKGCRFVIMAPTE